MWGRRNILSHIASHSAKTVKFMTSKTCTQSATVQLHCNSFYFRAKKHGIITLFTIASIAAAEKRPLSYQTPQSVHRAQNCGVQTLPLTMHYGGEKLWENWGRNCPILTTNELDLTIWVPDYGAKFHQNWVRIATVGGWTNRQMWQTRVNLLSVPCYAIAMGQTNNKMLETGLEDRGISRCVKSF